MVPGEGVCGEAQKVTQSPSGLLGRFKFSKQQAPNITYNRAREYLPTTRFKMSYALVQPKREAAVAGIKAQVAKLGYGAFADEEFNQRITNCYTYKTGIGTNILLMTVIAFIVGPSISGQTFYTFILENLEKFGALKAVGAKGRELVFMIMFRALWPCLRR